MLLFGDTFKASWYNLLFTLLSMQISISPQQQLQSRTRSRNDTENCPFQPPLLFFRGCVPTIFSPSCIICHDLIYTPRFFLLVSFPLQKCIKIAAHLAFSILGIAIMVGLPQRSGWLKIDVMVAGSVTKQEGSGPTDLRRYRDRTHALRPISRSDLCVVT